jgi:hypothetical protein
MKNKYQWRKDGELVPRYIVFHTEDDKITIIAVTPDAEKADLVAKALNLDCFDITETEKKLKVAVLAHSRESFDEWVRQNGNHTEHYVAILSRNHANGHRFDKIEKAHNWFCMPKAYEALDLCEHNLNHF